MTGAYDRDRIVVTKGLYRGGTDAPRSSFNLFQSPCTLISSLSSMAALRIKVDLESKPDIGSGKSLLDAISRAPLSPRVEKREIHREGSRVAVVPAVKYRLY